MAKHPRLTKRKDSNQYYFRAKVPVDLHDHYGKKEITHSLRTSAYQEAVEQLHVASVKLDQEFAEVAAFKTYCKSAGTVSRRDRTPCCHCLP